MASPSEEASNDPADSSAEPPAAASEAGEGSDPNNEAMRRVLHREMWAAYRRRERSNELVEEIYKKVDEIKAIDRRKKDEEDYYKRLATEENAGEGTSTNREEQQEQREQQEQQREWKDVETAHPSEEPQEGDRPD